MKPTQDQVGAPGTKGLVRRNQDADPVNQVRPVKENGTGATLFRAGEPPLGLTHGRLLQPRAMLR